MRFSISYNVYGVYLYKRLTHIIHIRHRKLFKCQCNIVNLLYYTFIVCVARVCRLVLKMRVKSIIVLLLSYCLQRTCNDELEWYKSLKDTQDSVTSYGEMNNILKHGVFRIESNSSSVVTKLHSIITLRLNTTDRKITKRHYSFVELQDLESKLVLITGSKTKNRHEVDLFLDVSCIL